MREGPQAQQRPADGPHITEATTPTAEQAQSFIDQAAQWVVSECGQLPVDLPPTDELMAAARTAAEWRAAADIEVAYPLNRDPDVQLFRVPDQRAKDALATVRSAMQGEGAGQVDLVPYWHFPCPQPAGPDPRPVHRRRGLDVGRAPRQLVGHGPDLRLPLLRRGLGLAYPTALHGRAAMLGTLCTLLATVLLARLGVAVASTPGFYQVHGIFMIGSLYWIVRPWPKACH